MSLGNPYFEEIRAAVNREEWNFDIEDAAENTDLTESEVEAVVVETVRRIRSALHHQEQSVDSLPSLLSTLMWLSSEWSHYGGSSIGPGVDDETKIEGIFYNTAQMAAHDEADKVEYVLEEYY